MGLGCGETYCTRACNLCLGAPWRGSKGQEPWCVGGACTYGATPCPADGRAPMMALVTVHDIWALGCNAGDTERQFPLQKRRIKQTMSAATCVLPCVFVCVCVCVCVCVRTCACAGCSNNKGCLKADYSPGRCATG